MILVSQTHPQSTTPKRDLKNKEDWNAEYKNYAATLANTKLTPLVIEKQPNEEWKDMFGPLDSNWSSTPSTPLKKSTPTTGTSPFAVEILEVMDFGTTGKPRITPSTKPWRPVGVNVAHIMAHDAAINQIQVTKDFSFFCSAANDGFVKIWDCAQHEKSVVFTRPRVWYQLGGQVTALSLCENSTSIICGNSLGNIHIVRIKCGTKSVSPQHMNYDKDQVTLLKTFDVKSPVVHVDHYENGNDSVMIFATADGWIQGYDLRSDHVVFRLQNKAPYGAVCSAYVSPTHHWLCVGTVRGYVTMWDTRFQIPVKEWRPSKSAIYSIQAMQQNTLLIASGRGDMQVTEWNVEDEAPQCRKRLCMLSKDSRLTNIVVGDSEAEDLFGLSDSSEVYSKNCHSTRTLLPIPNSHLLFTAGSDRRIRCWDLLHPSSSYIVSNPYKSLHSRFVTNEVEGEMIIDEVTEEDESIVVAPDGILDPSTAHSETITDLKFMESANSRLLVSGSADGVIKLWK